MDSFQKICKYCQKEIPKQAKRCPLCQGDLRNWFAQHVGLTIFLAIILIVVANVANKSEPTLVEKTPKKVETNNLKTETPPPAAPTVFRVGDTIKLGDYILTINEVKDCVLKNEFLQPAEGKKYITADITQENRSDKSVSYNALDFNLQDNQDFSYSTNFMSCREPSFNSGDLIKGQKTRGYITFELPKENVPARLIFAPLWLSEGQIIVELKGT